MEKRYTQSKKQDLLDKLSELANLLSTGRRSDPNSRQVKLQLEAIQTQLEKLQCDGSSSKNEESGTRN
jgi:hypothetical protein